MAEHTNKDVLFLSDRRAVEIVRSILIEVDLTVSASAHRSTVYLCVSAIEGIFGDLLRLLQPVEPAITANWPRTKAGRLRDVRRLKLSEREEILRKANVLPRNFDPLYDPLRQFRNYIHPQAELAALDSITLSTAQAGLCALNSLIEKYRQERFLGNSRWEAAYGTVHVAGPAQVHLMPSPSDDVALLVSRDRAQRWKEVVFDLVVPPGAIFDFVYNYSSKDNFRAIRIDKRVSPTGTAWDSGRLVCTKWRHWMIDAHFSTEPQINQEHHRIEVQWRLGQAPKFLVDGVPITLVNRPQWDFRQDRRIGFMSECGSGQIFKIQLQ